MPEEIGIVMTLYDRVSPTLKAIAGNNRAFDKTLDDAIREQATRRDIASEAKNDGKGSVKSIDIPGGSV